MMHEPVPMPPTAWRGYHHGAKLVCSNCGYKMFDVGSQSEWEECERFAEYEKNKGHRCPVSLEKLTKAREEMKKIRHTREAMSFDEQMDEYKKLIN